MLRDGNEDARRQCHVEDSVTLLSILLKVIEMLVKLLEWFILIVLSGDVCASFAESFQLFLDILGGCLDV